MGKASGLFYSRVTKLSQNGFAEFIDENQLQIKRVFSNVIDKIVTTKANKTQQTHLLFKLNQIHTPTVFVRFVELNETLNSHFIYRKTQY